MPSCPLDRSSNTAIDLLQTSCFELHSGTYYFGEHASIYYAQAEQSIDV